jgi:MFS family permease
VPAEPAGARGAPPTPNRKLPSHVALDQQDQNRPTPGHDIPVRGPGVQLPDAPARPPAVQASPAASPLGGPFAALRHRDFRIFYFGQIVSLVGTWMQSTAQGWLVLEITDSELMLGLVTAIGSFPVLLFTLYAGVLADRADKRGIIIAAQGASAVIALTLAVLTDFGMVTIGWILLLAFLLGTANAFEIPTRQAFFVELVGKDDLTNAIALNSSAFNLTRIIGPATAGVLIGSVGIAAAFYVNAVSYLAVLAGLLLIRRPRAEPQPRDASTLEKLREGFAFLGGDRRVGTLVMLVAAASIFAMPYAMLLPVFARDILVVGAEGLGVMLSASGAGALAGGIALAAGARRVRRGPLILISAAVFACMVGGFTLSRSFPLSLALLAGAGFTLIPFTASVNALIQSLVPDALRGRVMSVYVFMFLGMTPVGALQAGFLARLLGAPLALALSASVLLVIVGVTAWRVPELRRLR